MIKSDDLACLDEICPECGAINKFVSESILGAKKKELLCIYMAIIFAIIALASIVLALNFNEFALPFVSLATITFFAIPVCIYSTGYIKFSETYCSKCGYIVPTTKKELKQPRYRAGF